MKWFHLLPVAAVLTLTASLLADEVARPKRLAEIQAGLPLPTAVRGPTMYADYPAEAYPAGFSSYRGTGFMGSCCEQNTPDVACLWNDYCGPKDHHVKQFVGHGNPWKHTCCQPGCAPGVVGCGSGCCGPGANFWPMTPCSPPLGERLRCLKANVCGLFPSPHALSCTPNCRGCEAGSRTSPTPAADAAPLPPELPTVPVPTPSADPAPTVPQVPAPPTPAVEVDAAPVPPNLPAPPAADQTTQLPLPMLNSPLGAALVLPRPSPQDKSASMMEPRSLRTWAVSF